MVAGLCLTHYVQRLLFISMDNYSNATNEQMHSASCLSSPLVLLHNPHPPHTDITVFTWAL